MNSSTALALSGGVRDRADLERQIEIEERVHLGAAKLVETLQAVPNATPAKVREAEDERDRSWNRLRVLRQRLDGDIDGLSPEHADLLERVVELMYVVMRRLTPLHVLR